MKIKGLVITVAILAVFSVIAYIANRPAALPSADSRVGQPVADANAIEKAAKLKLASGGKTVTLTRQRDNSWVVESYYGLPADFQKLSRFANDLLTAKVQKLSTTNPDKIARLEFKDTQISLLDSADKSLWSITLGKNFPSGGRFLRYNDEQKAYLADLNTWIDADGRSWADSTLISLKDDDIAKVEIGFTDGGPVTVARAKKGDPFTAENLLAGQKLKSEKVTALLGSLNDLRFSDTFALNDEKVAAAKTHTRTITLTTFDGKTITIVLSQKPEEKIVKPALNTAMATPTPAVPKPNSETAPQAGSSKPAEPVTETIPAGPVFVFITHSDASAPVNALMKKRAFQVAEYLFTSLPQKRDELFETVTPVVVTPAAAAKPNTAPTSKPAEKS